jgi:hypothetical protein
MKNSRLLGWALVNSIGTFLYVAGVAWFLFNAEWIFGKQAPDFWVPVIMLLIFILSATVTSALVLGRPIYLYLKGLKKESIKLLVYTVVFLFIITSLVLLSRLLQ